MEKKISKRKEKNKKKEKEIYMCLSVDNNGYSYYMKIDADMRIMKYSCDLRVQ